MPDPCPAAELVEGPEGPASVCRVESTGDGLAGRGNMPVSIVKERTSPVSFARCAGKRRQAKPEELIAGVVSLDSDGQVIGSECHEHCPSWRAAVEHTGTGRWIDDQLTERMRKGLE